MHHLTTIVIEGGRFGMSEDQVVIDSDSVIGRHQNPGGKFDVEIKDLSDHTKLEELGFRLYRVSPGKTAWPHHAHMANEEVLYILEGEGILRYKDEERSVSEGDFLCFPADPDAPHQLVNTGDQDLRYLSFSTMNEPDAIVYPDSDKIGVFSGEAPGGASDQRNFQKVLDLDAELDYWEGEIGSDNN